jgi:hypothetical protein
VWVDFTAEIESDVPYTAGEVLKLVAPPDVVPVDNPTVIFTKP